MTAVTEMVERATIAAYNKWHEGLIGYCEPAWEEIESESYKDRFRQSIAAAIEAMDPTEAMKLAGARSIRDTMGNANHTMRASACYRVMNAAALEPTKDATTAAPIVAAPGGGRAT